MPILSAAIRLTTQDFIDSCIPQIKGGFLTPPGGVTYL